MCVSLFISFFMQGGGKVYVLPGFQAEFVFGFHGPGIPDIPQGFFQDGGAFYCASLVIDVGGGEAHRVSRDNGAAGEDVIGGTDIYIFCGNKGRARKGAVFSMRQIDFRHEGFDDVPVRQKDGGFHHPDDVFFEGGLLVFDESHADADVFIFLGPSHSGVHEGFVFGFSCRPPFELHEPVSDDLAFIVAVSQTFFEFLRVVLHPAEEVV